MGTGDEELRLDLISAIGSQDSYLAVVSTLRSDGSPHSSVVNAAVVAHPVTGAQVGAFVTYGPVKLAHLRRRPALTLTWRSGWSWVSLDGTAQLAGPHDRLPDFDPDHLPGHLHRHGRRARPRPRAPAKSCFSRAAVVRDFPPSLSALTC